MQIAIHRNCVCLELNQLKSPLKCRRALRRHPRVNIAGVMLLFSLVLIAGTSPEKSISARREQVPFSMAIGNWELMHECFPKHPRMGTAR